MQSPSPGLPHGEGVPPREEVGREGRSLRRGEEPKWGRSLWAGRSREGGEEPKVGGAEGGA